MKNYVFSVRGRKSHRDVYVPAKSLKDAVAKFTKAYPKAEVHSLWVDRNVPEVLR